MAKRIGILTGGGDAPGLNAVIRAVVRAAATAGFETVGFEDAFEGVIHGRSRPLTCRDVAGIYRLGGTILGTTNRGTPLGQPGVPTPAAERDAVRCAETFRALELDALIVIGGDGTLAIADLLRKRGMPIVGVPKTIDNDIAETATTFGFDSAVACATDAIDRLHTTADAHHRTMVLEVMGRYSGWIALCAGLAGGADGVLIPEIPFDLERLACRIESRERSGARWSVVVVSEGARPVGGERSVAVPGQGARLERLGGIGERVAKDLEQLTGRETRFTVLGHLQRGGTPTSTDRLLATRFGVFAVELVRCRQFGVMVANRPPDLAAVPLERVVGRTHPVPIEGDLVRSARSLGICLGD